MQRIAFRLTVPGGFAAKAFPRTVVHMARRENRLVRCELIEARLFSGVSPAAPRGFCRTTPSGGMPSHCSSRSDSGACLPGTTPRWRGSRRTRCRVHLDGLRPNVFRKIREVRTAPPSRSMGRSTPDDTTRTEGAETQEGVKLDSPACSDLEAHPHRT